MCHLKAVLFAAGRGSNPSEYRPHRDESQWWGRRDALVRCVAAFLTGPAQSSQTGSIGTRELVLLFDEDYAHIHMQYDHTNSGTNAAMIVPTEKAVISIWKQAATVASIDGSVTTSKVVETGGLRCWIVKQAVNDSQDRPASSMESKRDVLAFLQANCSLDFLRSHGLNSSTDVILRKCNKASLMKVLNEWKQQQHKQNRSSGKKNAGTGESEQVADVLIPIMSDIINSSPQGVTRKYVATLHESSENELPCWGHPPDSTDSDTQVIIFLGAVRDMSSIELRVLQDVCMQEKLPLLRVRVGPVPEFTSKILSVIAFHHAHGYLGLSMKRMAEMQTSRKRKHAEDSKKLATASHDSTSTNTEGNVTILHTVCIVPIETQQFTLSMENRSRLLWCMVRCTVASLWRSRLAGQEYVSPLRNRLSFVFSDGTVLTLEQESLVQSMAEQHQAAPSEYQILSAITRQLESLDQRKRGIGKVAGEDGDSLCQKLFEEDLPEFCMHADCYGGSSGDEAVDLVSLFYQSTELQHSKAHSLALLLLLSDSVSPSPLPSSHRRTSVQMDLLLQHLERRNVSIIHGCMHPSPCQDWEASCIGK
jgi:hypothetical protein